MSNISGNNSNLSMQNQLNSVARDVQNSEVVQIFKDDTGTRRVLSGRGADGFYGFKVSQEGIDVYEATDDQLVFNSNQNVFKIVFSDTTTWTPSGGSSTLTIPHNLGYIPVALVYLENNAGARSPLPVSASQTISGGVLYFQDYFYFDIDDTNLYISNAEVLGGTRPSRSIKYYLLQETAN